MFLALPVDILFPLIWPVKLMYNTDLPYELILIFFSTYNMDNTRKAIPQYEGTDFAIENPTISDKKTAWVSIVN
jgi:hypothetical protein